MGTRRCPPCILNFSRDTISQFGRKGIDFCSGEKIAGSWELKKNCLWTRPENPRISRTIEQLKKRSLWKKVSGTNVRFFYINPPLKRTRKPTEKKKQANHQNSKPFAMVSERINCHPTIDVTNQLKMVHRNQLDMFANNSNFPDPEGLLFCLVSIWTVLLNLSLIDPLKVRWR